MNKTTKSEIVNHQYFIKKLNDCYIKNPISDMGKGYNAGVVACIVHLCSFSPEELKKVQTVASVKAEGYREGRASVEDKKNKCHKKVNYDCPCWSDGFETAEAENGFNAKAIIEGLESMKEEKYDNNFVTQKGQLTRDIVVKNQLRKQIKQELEGENKE